MFHALALLAVFSVVMADRRQKGDLQSERLLLLFCWQSGRYLPGCLSEISGLS
ncbi:hypothetical Protein YC6258_05654 [Gynuella sunshinyii YC6258]|uniref:Uncharacterized protein n=1 Tax=Gynuella sunshinyii YC6258 TaxID=1445510 RepID=A0A0C5VU35_9GAMM|nr:hypothetical Protein YC6258_05654 [Gynuella sunshinyii YC6258]